MITGGLSMQMVVLASLTVKPLLDGVLFPDHFVGAFVLFGPVITTAFSGATIHSNNTAEMTAMFEALSFLGPQGPVTHDEQSRIYYDTVHAAGICLGTIQSRTHVQLALACQQCMIRHQHRLRLTMQHVFGHGENLGNGCADHAAHLFFPHMHFALQEEQWKAQLRVSLPHRVLVKVSRTTRGMLSWNCFFTNTIAAS